MMLEVWLPIPGFVGKYEVSNMGRVRSLDRVVVDRNGREVRRIGVLLKPAPSTSGHLSVVLGRGKTRQVHQLVMLAFEGPAPSGCEVLHKDHDPSNNRLSNLRYGTRSQNLQMDYDAGRRSKAAPVVAVLSDGSRVEHLSISAAARAYGVSQPAASLAVKNGATLRKSKVRIEYVV